MKLGKLSRPLFASGIVVALAASGTALAAPAMADDTVSPKNVIVLIGDGMGYNHVDFFNAETTGETYWQVQRGGDNKVIPSGQNATPTEGWQSWDMLGMSTYWSEGNVYDPQKSWTDFEWNKDNPTDSAAAGTAMATGVKTYNAGIGVDTEEQVVENLSERAKSLGKSAGVVSSVPYSHATPAAYSSHNVSRNDYHGIANEQINGDLEVVIGAAHPFYNDDHEQVSTGNFTYISEADWNAVSTGQTDRTFIESNEDFEKLTTGDTPEKVFGTPQVASTLQQARSAGAEKNDVPDLTTLAQGAINVLDNNENGFMLMIEGGAIDWAGHANQDDRDLEEVEDFDKAVDSVIDWVETNSSWDETLVVVTADHETGYLYGETSGDFSPIIPAAADAPEGTLPTHTWNHTNHTNQLAPFFYKGAGAEAITALGDKRDLVRGHYLDNTSMASWLLNDAWKAEEPSDFPFTDVDQNGIYFPAIKWALEEGITQGTSETEFSPKESVNRAQMALFLYRLAGEPEVTLPETSPFPDVRESDASYRAIVWLQQQGLTNGVTKNGQLIFDKFSPVTRGQMAAFLYRYQGSPQYTIPSGQKIDDVAESNVFFTEINWLAAEGITTPYTTSSGQVVFRPKNDVLREQMATLLYRMEVAPAA